MVERRFPPPAVTWSSKSVQAKSVQAKPVQAKPVAAAGVRPPPVPQPAQRPAPPAVVQHKAGGPSAHGGFAPPAPARPTQPPVVQHKAGGQAQGIVQRAFDPGPLGPFSMGTSPLDGLSEREIRQARRGVRAAGGRAAGRITGDRIRHAVLENRKAARLALDPDGEHAGWHIPTSAWAIHKVGANYYKFYNDALGYVDFDNAGVYAAGDTTEDGKAVPAATVYAAMPYAALLGTVNIFHSTKKGTDYMIDPVTGGASADTLKQNNRAPHDAVANALRGTPKPAGYTWHHHKTKGRMDLVKTTVHASFAHRGGFSLWGRK
jgi:hypothetical protein